MRWAWGEAEPVWERVLSNVPLMPPAPGPVQEGAPYLPPTNVCPSLVGLEKAEIDLRSQMLTHPLCLSPRFSSSPLWGDGISQPPLKGLQPVPNPVPDHFSAPHSTSQIPLSSPLWKLNFNFGAAPIDALPSVVPWP